MESLDLSGNKINSLPENIGDLKNLKEILLTGIDSLMELPKSFRKLNKLEKIELSGTGIKSYYDYFKNFSVLREVSIGSTNNY